MFSYQDELPERKPLDWESNTVRLAKFIGNTALKIAGSGIEAVKGLLTIGRATKGIILNITGGVVERLNNFADQSQFGPSNPTTTESQKNW